MESITQAEAIKLAESAYFVVTQPNATLPDMIIGIHLIDMSVPTVEEFRKMMDIPDDCTVEYLTSKDALSLSRRLEIDIEFIN